MLFWYSTEGGKYDYQVLCGINESLYRLGELFFLAYNVIYCFDFFVTLRYPLISGKNIYYSYLLF